MTGRIPNAMPMLMKDLKSQAADNRHDDQHAHTIRRASGPITSRVQ